MSRFGHLRQLGGIEIDVAFPLWLLRLGRISVAVWLFGVLALIVLGAIFEAWTDSTKTSVSTGPALAMTGDGFTARPITYQIRVTAGSEAAKDLGREWTVLMSSGAVHWANVVDGPARLEPGESASLVLTFLFEPAPGEGEPVALRWDPGRKLGASLELRR